MSPDRIAMAMALSLVVGCAPSAPRASGQPAALASLAVNGAACSGSELSACNCPNGYYCCPTDGSCFNDTSQVIYTQCTNNQGATCKMGATTGTAQCSGSQLSACNCPNGYYCCPTDGSCFNDTSQVIYTQCTNNPSATCLMGSSSTTSSGGGGGTTTTTGTVNGAACTGSEVAACNCPNGYYCCPTDGSCFNDTSQVVYTQCNNNTGATCKVGGTTTTGQCSGSQLAACNCPTGYDCCPTDGSCFNDPSQVVYTQCKNNTGAVCSMGGTTSGSGGGGGTSGGGGGGTVGSLPTRLRIANNCSQNIWIAHDTAVTDAQNIELGQGASHDYNIPAAGVSAVRFWPKLGCDGSGHNCSIGDNGQGGGVPCPANGCQPPIDSKFEVTYSAVGGSAATFYNISQVDGYTLPFKVTPVGDGAGQNGCLVTDCSALSVNGCPSGDNLSEGGAFPQYGAEDERVRDSAGNVIGCISPCKKLNYPAPWGVGLSESVDPALHMCCPTPIDPSTGQCTVANGCMTADACRNTADPRSVTHTSYVAAVHSMCPSAYAYSYDDANGLRACPSDTQFLVTFCP